MRVLVLNPGSSSLKVDLVDGGRRADAGPSIRWSLGGDDAAIARRLVEQAIDDLPGRPDAVGYRVVHGGRAYRGPARVDDGLLQAVEALDELAPLHNLRAAAVMRAGRNALADLPHVACFDTAFHADLPEVAWRYPIPTEWVERWGIRRFGFHGLSIAWAVGRASELVGRAQDGLHVVVAHLGSGCSVTAVSGGRSVDTTMGFTPYEGLMMGTRSGSVDPGILLHLVRAGIRVDELADGLGHRSGLLGVSGTTASVSELEVAAARGDDRARLALDMFASRASAAIAAVATSLPQLDGLVFTGGIGEHSALVREAIVRRLGPLGVPSALVDPAGDGFAAPGRPFVAVVQAREDLVIADQVRAVVES